MPRSKVVEFDTAKTTTGENSLPMEKLVLKDDLKELTENERVEYYNKVCESMGLNPLTKPFEYISLRGKLVLYAKRDCTEQLRRINGISVKITGRDFLNNGVYVVQACATDKHGRCDESIGAVSVNNLKGEELANALMKAETKAKRRVTLSISGLGWLDETEVETIPTAQPPKNGGSESKEQPKEITADDQTQPQADKLVIKQRKTMQKEGKDFIKLATSQGILYALENLEFFNTNDEIPLDSIETSVQNGCTIVNLRKGA